MGAHLGRIIEFQYQNGLQEISDMLADLEASSDVSVDEDAREILLKAKRRSGEAKVLLTTPARLGFKSDFVTNDAVIRAGLKQGYHLCSPEAAIHLRKEVAQDRYEEPIIVAMEGAFVDDAVLTSRDNASLLLGLDREEDGEDAPAEVIHTIRTKVLKWSIKDGEREDRGQRTLRSSKLHQLWAFEIEA